MKIVVYTICKNEEQFVHRWYESMKEADEIYVLDTGSSDNTVQKLKSLGVKVTTKKINPWRFDIARNESLALVPTDTDICVCTDLDEVFEKGWRDTLESGWKSNTTRCKYLYNWSLDEHNKPLVSFYAEKIHARNNFKWVHPVHEVLEYNGIESFITLDNIILNHYPDATKSRSSYLPLLELSVKEEPNNDRNMHYLGREYMYYQKYQKAIDTLIKHTKMPAATWIDEKCASMRFIARCYTNLHRYDEAVMWLDKAINIAPHLRDPLIERAILAYQLNDYKSVHKYCLKALRIKTHAHTYINEPFSWNHTVYDLLSLSSYYYKNSPRIAIKYINKALELDKDNKRLQNNKTFFLSKLKEVN